MATPRLCSIPDCGKAVFSRGWCCAHWFRWRRHGDPLAGKRHRIAPGGICSASKCAEPATRHGLCSTHYNRLKRNGDANAPVRTPPGTKLSWIESHRTYHSDECLLWPFAKDRKGYGNLGHDGKQTGAHRLMCMMVNGHPPSTSHEAAHTCGNGHLGCVNPKHLEWKTKQDNERDKFAHGTRLRGANVGNSRLTEDDVQAIRAMIGTASYGKIASRFGVATSTVSAINHRKIWGWLP
jgi:hypothetical protein